MKRLVWLMLGYCFLHGSSVALADIWDRADPIPPDGWLESDWFGEFIPYNGTRGDGWLFHAKHGDLYASGSDENDVWLYDTGIGWFWTSADTHPYFFIWNGGQWVYFDEISGADGATRWFNVLSEDRWVSGADLQAGTAFLGGGSGSDGGDDGSGGEMTDTSPIAPDSLVNETFFIGNDAAAASAAKVGFSLDSDTVYAIGDDFYGVGSGIIWSNGYDVTDLGENVLQVRFPDNTTSGPDMYHLTFTSETAGTYIQYPLDDTSTETRTGFFELGAKSPAPSSLAGATMWTGDDSTEAEKFLGGWRFTSSRNFEVHVFGGTIGMGNYFYAPRTENRGRVILDNGRIEMSFQSSGNEGLYEWYDQDGVWQGSGYFILDIEI